MILNFSLCLVVFFSANLFAEPFKLMPREAIVKNHAQMDGLFTKYHRNLFQDSLHQFLAAGRPSRLVGTPGHAKAIQYLINRLKSFESKDITVTTQEFLPDIDNAKALYDRDFNEKIVGKFAPDSPEYVHWNRFTTSTKKNLEKFRSIKGTNIIWEKKGSITPNEVIVLSAHFDTIVNNLTTFEIDEKASMPGADDNASGVSVLLSLIDILEQLNTPKTVRIIFFDYEEIGFLGSLAYVKEATAQMQKEKIFGVINLEMLGHDTKKEDKNKQFGNMKLYIRKDSEIDQKFAKRLVDTGKKSAINVNFEITPNDFDHSDHINFWPIANLPVVTFSENWEDDFNEKKYHTSNDFAETLNMNTLYSSFRYISSGVISWLFDLK